MVRTLQIRTVYLRQSTRTKRLKVTIDPSRFTFYLRPLVPVSKISPVREDVSPSGMFRTFEVRSENLTSLRDGETHVLLVSQISRTLRTDIR